MSNTNPKFTPGPHEVAVHRDNISRGSSPAWGGRGEEVVGQAVSFSVIARRPSDKDTVLIAEINTSVRNPWRPPTNQHADAHLLASAWKAHEILAALAGWYRESGRQGPNADGMFDDEKTWGQVVNDYLKSAEGS